MKAALATTAAEVQPLGQSAPQSRRYNPVEQTPEFEIAVASKRAAGANVPHSKLWYGYTVEGVEKAPLSQAQIDYMASMLRHIASLIQSSPSIRSHKDPAIALARQLRIEAKASLDKWFDLLHHLAKTRDADELASLLGMDKRQLRKLARQAGRPSLKRSAEAVS